MEYGLTYEQFLDYDDEIINAHIKAFMYKRHDDAYVNGLYVYSAIVSSMSMIGNGDKISYPKQPYIYDIESQKSYEKLSNRQKDTLFRNQLNEWA